MNVFLIGRPNVGKSSLFNFLISQKEALVKDEEGTTLDWRSKTIGNIKLWDSPGVFKLEKLPVSPDLVFFVIDNYVLDVDKKLYLKLKACGWKILVVINKIDCGEDIDYSFFDEYIKVSVISRFNLFKLKSFLMDHYIESDLVDRKTWAVLGKPNVGKSSLINALLGFDLHKVKDEEGTTKELLPVDFDDNVLLDTPGQRKKPIYPHYDNVFGLIIMTDLSREKQDFKMISLACKRKKPVFLVINKCDLISKKEAFQRLKMDFSRFSIPIIEISCATKKGIYKVFNIMRSLEKNYYKRVSTGHLNNWLVKCIKPVEPKIKFITQVEVAYPKFYIDCTLAKDKIVMLKKRLSKEFGFEGIPIDVIVH